ncbi:MAG: hypothetical protein ACMZ7B_04705 [Balneola sp.]
MKKIFTKHIFLRISIVYSLVILIYSIIRFSTNITFENNTLDSALLLGFFTVPLMGIFWLTYIKQTWIKAVSILVYILLLLPFYAVSSLAIIFTANDVFSMNNNGYRAIFENPIEDDRSLIVYRTPDKGALGGDFIDVAVVKRIGLGLVNRNFSENINYSDVYSDYGGKIFFEGKEYYVPPLKEIESNGNLK